MNNPLLHRQGAVILLFYFIFFNLKYFIELIDLIQGVPFNFPFLVDDLSDI